MATIAADSATRLIRVGLTEGHGMADEVSHAPPSGIQYEFLEAAPHQSGLIRSPIKGFMRRYDDRHVDLVEAVLSPAITDRPWIYSADCFEAAMAFTFLRFPLPKFVRRRYLERLFLRENFKRMVFWSRAALRSMRHYGGIENDEVIRKSTVVYPAVREVPAELQAAPAQGLQLLFMGKFFRKGGAHVVDAFEILQRDFPEATLRICCDEQRDFNASDPALRDEYLAKIKRNPGIRLGRVSRSDMLAEVLPQTSVYLLPTYAEAFGFAILEAMSYGIPVVASNVFAIPEMIESGKDGLLIEIDDYDLGSICRGYIVRSIPKDFRNHVTGLLVEALRRLAESPQLRTTIGNAARERVRTDFSFERRNAEMSRIYAQAVA